jgi:hypothetical protein
MTAIVMREKVDAVSEDEVKKKLDDSLQICGLIDAAFSALSVIDPTPDEIDDARRKVKKLMILLRAQGHSMPLKAHIVEQIWSRNARIEGTRLQGRVIH